MARSLSPWRSAIALSSRSTSLRAIAAASRLVGGRLPAPQDAEQRPVALLRAIELPVVARQLGERAQDLGVLRVDARRGVELDERAGAVAHRELQPRHLVVDGRALLGSPPAEGVDHRLEDGARLVEAARVRQRLGEPEPHALVLRRQVARLLQQRDGRLRLAASVGVEPCRLEQARHLRRLVGRVRGRPRHEPGQLRPRALLAVERREPIAHGRRPRDRRGSHSSRRSAARAACPAATSASPSRRTASVRLAGAGATTSTSFSSHSAAVA